MVYSISQAAAKMNVSAYTLRYYDKEGLLPMVERRGGGIRVFNDNDFGWLRLIGCLKASGLSIKEIKQYIDWAMEGDSTLEKRREMFYARKKAVEEQMAELQKTLNTVTYKCWFYDTAVAAGTESAPKNTKFKDMPEEIQKAYKESNLYRGE